MLIPVVLTVAGWWTVTLATPPTPAAVDDSAAPWVRTNAGWERGTWLLPKPVVDTRVPIGEAVHPLVVGGTMLLFAMWVLCEREPLA